MTVQELIIELNKVEDKDKDVYYWYYPREEDDFTVLEEIQENDSYVLIS